MKVFLTIILIQVTILLHSQNWAVFNKNYRYNYSLQNENYTTVVIFADSIKVNGTDTTYCLNRIAGKCDSCLLANPGAADDDYLLDNQPQFMQRRIVYSNNQYRLSDTSNYIIPRYSNINDTWIFNAPRGINATVITLSIKTIFGISDSVRTILLSTNDTVIVSKQFGIVKYPAKFNQQQYYMLRGIENKNGESLNAFFGEKVPNYFEFFQLKPGVEHYYSERHVGYGTWPNNQCDRHVFGRKIVLSSSVNGTVITNNYTDEVKGCPSNCGANQMCTYNPAVYPTSYTSTTYTISNHPASNGFTEVWNSYNNMLFSHYAGPSSIYYVVKFGMTENQKFYKTYGITCFGSNIQQSPIQRTDIGVFYYQSLENPHVYYTTHDNSNGFQIFGETFIEGYGQVNSFSQAFESDDLYCTSAIIDGQDTLGDFSVKNVVTEIAEQNEQLQAKGYPNPSKDIFTLDLPYEVTGEIASLKIHDALGKIVLEKQIEKGSHREVIDLRNASAGLYFGELTINRDKYRFKFVKE